MTTNIAPSCQKRWLSSKEAKVVLKVSDCHLMHLRMQGALIFKKEGNRFFYLLEQEPNKYDGEPLDL